MHSIAQYNSYEIDKIGKLGKFKLYDDNLITKLKQLGILRCRGKRAGLPRVKSLLDSNQGVHLKYLRPIPESIETITMFRYEPLTGHVEGNTHQHSSKTLVKIKRESNSKIVVGEKNLKYAISTQGLLKTRLLPCLILYCHLTLMLLPLRKLGWAALLIKHA